MQLCYNGLVRKTSSILLAMLGLRVFALSVPELPRTDYADTEVSTNVTLTALNPDDRLFSLVLELDAAADNAVEVALGTDRDGDGELGVEESELSLGWVTGAWFLEDYRAGVSARTERPEGRRTLTWSVRLDEAGASRSAVVLDGQHPVLTSATGVRRKSFYSADWDLVRVTVRGVSDPAERISFKVSSVGLEVRVR